MVATDDDQLERLHKYLANARNVGAESGVRMLSGREARARVLS